MSDKPTTTQLLADGTLLRQTIWEVLEPKPWKHSPSGCGSNVVICDAEDGIEYGIVGNKCRRCGEPVDCEFGCRVPDRFVGPLEVAVARMQRTINEGELWNDIYLAVMAMVGKPYWVVVDVWFWLLWKATHEQQAVCLLVALGAAEVKP